jgi:hypothetical protein
VAYCEIPYENRWTKGTNRYSWIFRNNISTERKSQHDCGLENQFTSHNLCDENHERQVETTAQALLASVDGIPMEKASLVTYIISKFIEIEGGLWT